MLVSMCGLLSDETLDRCIQLGIVDGALEVPDRSDEEILAFRERRRKHRDEMAHHQVAIHEVLPLRGGGHGETNAPGFWQYTALGRGSIFRHLDGVLPPLRDLTLGLVT